MVVLYHYTSEENCSGIQKDGYVERSTGEGANYYGPGVYLTTLYPLTHTRRDIGRNHYGGACEYRGRMNKVQVALEFEIKDGKVRDLAPARGADVWRYDDGNLLLKGYFTGRVFVADPVGDGYIQK